MPSANWKKTYGGLCAANVLNAFGIAAEVFEAAPEPGEIGAAAV